MLSDHYDRAPVSGQSEDPPSRRNPGTAAATAVVLGIVGVGLGVIAIAGSSIWAGALAGVAALVAGVVAMTGGNGVNQDEIDELRRNNEALAERLAATESDLHAARSTVEELRTELESTASDTGSGSGQLTDPETGLFSGAYFNVALDSRIAAARRHLRPVAVALIEIAEGQSVTGTVPAPPSRGAESIRQTLRDADTACRLDDDTFAIILEDTPETGAVWTVERVRRNLVSRFGTHTMWAGVACYPAHAFSSEELLTQARSALSAAREWNQDRIEVALTE